jgi:hypothetical protein
MHGLHAQGWLHLLRDDEQHAGVLRLLLRRIADSGLQIAD